MTNLERIPIDEATDAEYSIEDDVNLYNSLFANVSAQNSLAWRTETVRVNSPWLASTGRADYPLLIAQEQGIPDNQLGDMAAQMWGMYLGSNLADTLKQQNPSVQRSIFSQLSYAQQQTLLSSGYNVPDARTHSPSRTSEIISAAVSPARWALSDIAKPAGMAAINAVVFAQDQIVGRQFRTIAQLSTGGKIAAAGGAVAAGAFGASLVAASGATGMFAPITFVGLTALTGASISSFAYEALSGNADRWIQAFARAGDGEKLFRPAAITQVQNKLNNPDLQALVTRIAAEVDQPEDLMQLVREVAGQRDAQEPSRQLDKLKKLAEETYEQGTPEYQNYLKGLIEIINVPVVQEAILTLQQNKISAGREFARGIGLDPKSSAYRYVSGSVDAATLILLDPLNIIAPAVRGVQAARRGIEYGQTAQQAARFRKIAERPEMQRVFNLVAEGVVENNTRLIKRYVPQWLPLFDDLRAYKVGNNFERFTGNDVVEFIVGHGQLKSIQSGIGIVPGTSKMILRGLGPVRYSTRTITGEIGDFFRAASDLRLEQIINKINEDPRAFTELLLDTPNPVAQNNLEILSDLNLLPEGITKELIQRAGLGVGYRAGRTVAQTIAPVPGLSQLFSGLGGLVDTLSMRVPAGKAIYLVENNQRSEDIVNFVDLFRTTGMPTYVRELWKQAIFDAPDYKTRIKAVTSFFDSIATASGMKLTERGAEMVERFLYHYQQHYAVGKANATIDGLDSIAAGVRPVADMAQMIVIPNLQELRRAIKNGTILRKVAGIPEDFVLAANITKVWKPVVLLRFGFALRNIGEDVIAMLARYGTGYFIDELAERSLGKANAYSDLVKDIEKTDRLYQSGKGVRRSLTSTERFILDNYQYPVGTRTLRHAMERLGPVGDVGLLLLRDMTAWVRDFVRPGLDRGTLRTALASLESNMASWNQLADVGFVNRLAPKYLRENLKYTLDQLAWGNPRSVRRLLAGGLSPHQVKKGRIWAEKHVFSIMQRLGTAPGYGMDLAGRELSLIERMMGPDPTPATTIYGERAVVPFGTESELIEDSHVALHNNFVSLTADPVIRSALPELGNVYDSAIEAVLPRDVLASIVNSWHQTVLKNVALNVSESGNSELLHMFLILNETRVNPTRFAATRRQFLARWGESDDPALARVINLLKDPALNGGRVVGVNEFVAALDGHAFGRQLQDIQALFPKNEVGKEWILQQIARDFHTNGQHFDDILGRPTSNGVVYRGVESPEQYEILPDGSLRLTLFSQDQWESVGRAALSVTMSYDQAAIYAQAGLSTITGNLPIAGEFSGQVITMDIDGLLSAFGLARSDVLRAGRTSYSELPQMLENWIGANSKEPFGVFVQSPPFMHAPGIKATPKNPDRFPTTTNVTDAELALSIPKKWEMPGTPAADTNFQFHRGLIDEPNDRTAVATQEFIDYWNGFIDRVSEAGQKLRTTGEKISFDEAFFPSDRYEGLNASKTTDLENSTFLFSESQVYQYWLSNYRLPNGGRTYLPSPFWWDAKTPEQQLQIIDDLLKGYREGASPFMPLHSVTKPFDPAKDAFPWYLPREIADLEPTQSIILPPGTFEIRRVHSDRLAPDDLIIGNLGVDDIANKFFATVDEARNAMALKMVNQLASGNWDSYLAMNRRASVPEFAQMDYPGRVPGYRAESGLRGTELAVLGPAQANVSEVFVVDLSNLPPWAFKIIGDPDAGSFRGAAEYFLPLREQLERFRRDFSITDDTYLGDPSTQISIRQEGDAFTPEFVADGTFAKAVPNAEGSMYHAFDIAILEALDQKLPLVFTNEKAANAVRDALEKVFASFDPYKLSPDTISLSSSSRADSIDYVVPPVKKTFLPIGDEPNTALIKRFSSSGQSQVGRNRLGETNLDVVRTAQTTNRMTMKVGDSDELIEFEMVGWPSREYPFISDYLNDVPVIATQEEIINAALDLVEQTVRPSFNQQWVARRPLWYQFDGEMIEIAPGEVVRNVGTLYTAPEPIEANVLQSLDDSRFMEPLDPTYGVNSEVQWNATAPWLYDEAEDLGGRHVTTAKEWLLDPGTPNARLSDTRADVESYRDARVASTVRVPRFTVDDVRRIPDAELPNVVIVKRQNVGPQTLGEKAGDFFQRAMNFGFNKVLGPMMDTVARRPMAYHAFSLNVDRIMRTSSWLTDQTDDFRKVNSLIERLISKNLYSKADSQTSEIFADAGRILARWDGIEEAEFFTAGQAFAYWRGARRSAPESFDDVVSSIIKSKGNGTLSAKEIAQLKFALKKSGQVEVTALEFGTPAEFVDEIAAIIGEDEMMKIFNLQRRPNLARIGKQNNIDDALMSALDDLTDEDWFAVAGYFEKRERLLEQAGEIAVEATIRDVMPYVDSHEMRSHFADWGRGFMPFWYAEENFLKRWGRIFAMDGGVNSINVLQKFYLTYTGMRHMGVIKRDADGKDFFVVPGSELMIDALSKVAGLETNGLSFSLKIPTDRMLPGIGGDFGRPSFSPLVVMPVDFLQGMFPEFEPLSKVERAFAGDYGVNRKPWEHFIPKQWVDSFAAADALFMSETDMSVSERLASSANAAMAYLEATGPKTPENPNGLALSPTATAAETDDYLRNAREWARVIVFAQKMAGWFAPGPVSANITTEDGNTLNIVSGDRQLDVRSFLADDYFELVADLGIEDGTIAYLQMYSNQFGSINSRAIFNPLAFTAGSTESVSGAPLPTTETAINFYLNNRETFDQYKYAGPWLIPADQSGDPRSQWAFDQTVIAGLRTARESSDDFLRELKFKEAAFPYFTRRDEYMARIAQLKESGLIEEARLETFAWENWSKNFRTANPVFAEELTSQTAKNRRKNVISEMTTLIKDPQFPQAPQFEAIKILTESFIKFDREISKLDMNNTSANRDLIKLEKQAFENWATSFIEKNPGAKPYWLTIIRPEAGLDL